ncbi:MAG: B12-binding domain-containing radical SAM protein [Candidatus Sericytochromatia bacterium]|nr:B12-binding domain-containing radical SAM protein [Candidatus Sericytochromatia bacterium]
MNAKPKEACSLLFVNPCLRKNSFSKLLPIGLGYVMTYFKTRGYSFDLLDVDLNEYSDEYIEDYLRQHPYDFVMLGSIVTHYKWVKWFVNTVKKHQPQAKVIVGNSVAGSIPEVFLKHTQADVVVIGEGEISAYETVEALRQQQSLDDVAGIAFRHPVSHEMIKTPVRATGPVDDFEMVNWDFFDVERYISSASLSHGFDTQNPQAVRVMPVSTARGCVFKCTFCHYVFWNDPYRHRSAESILAEVRRNIEKYQANYINFWDDLSFASAKQAERLADQILASGLKFSWSAAIRVDFFSRNKLPRERCIEIAHKMKAAGCKALGFSLESGNKEILEMMNKRIDVSAFLDTVEILREVDIVCNTSVVFGYPIETRESIRETFAQCLRAKVYPSIGFLLPLPGTGMYDYAKEHGFITDEDAYLDSITERQDICLNMTQLSDEDIMQEIKRGAEQLNELLQLGLDEERYIRTGRYQNDKGVHDKREGPLDPDNIQRNENDFSFNYSQTVFQVDGGKADAVC